MAVLYFRISSDWEQVVKLRNEITKLENQLKNFGKSTPEAEIRKMEERLASTKQQMMGLVTEAAKAGAEIENGFKKKIYDASQTVNGLSEKIIAQRAVIKDIEFDVKRLGDAYRTALKNNPIGASGKLAEYNAARKALDEEKAALFGLTQQQAEARLSVKKLRDEYSLYKREAGDTVEINNGLSLSWGKMLGIIGGVTALKSLASQIVRVRGEFQSMQTAIETMVGKDVASGLMAQLKEMAKISPLTLTDMVDAEKMMLGFNIQAEDSIRYLQALSDISMGDSVKFKSLTLAFSQMSAAGKLMGQDLNQMINAGFNPLQLIAEKTGKSISTLKDEMSKGAVSAEMVQQAFIDATSAGGKFYQMSENASKTINGQLSMMQDALDNAFNEMGQASEGVIMEGIQLTTTLIQNYEKVGAVLTGIVTAYGVYRAALLANLVLEKSRNGTLLTTIKNTKLATAAQAAFNKVLKAHPYALVASLAIGAAVAVYKFATSTSEAEKATERFNAIMDEHNKKEEEHKQAIDALISTIQDQNKAEGERLAAFEKLKAEYPAIFQNYTTETEFLKEIVKYKRQIAEEDTNRSTASLEKQLKIEQARLDHYVAFRAKNTSTALVDMDGNGWASDNVEDAIKAQTQIVNRLKAQISTPRVNSYLESIKTLKDEDIKSVLDEITLSMKALGDSGKDAIAIVESLGGEFSKEQLGMIKSALETEQKSRSERTTYAEDYEQARKDWEEAKKELQKIDAEKDNFNSKQYEDAKKRVESTEKAYKKLGGLTGTALSKQQKEADKEKKSRQKLSDQLLALQEKNQQAEVNLMKEGAEKKLAQIDADYSAQKAAVDRQQRELAEANKEAGITSTNANGLTTDQQAEIDRANKLATESRKKQIEDVYRAETDAMRAYISEYGTFQQKKLAITEEYNRKIAEAQTAGEAAILQKQMEEALSSLNMDKLKQEINWELVFSDLGNASKKSLEKVKKQLKNFKESNEYKEMSVEQIQVVDEALNKIQGTIIDKGGLLGDLPNQLEELRKAQEELNKAQEEYNQALKGGTEAQKESSQKKLNEAQKKLVNQQGNVNKATDKAIGNFQLLSHTLTELGETSEMSLSQLGNLVQGIAGAFGESGSKIGGIIGSVFSLLDSIGSQGLDGFVGNIFKSVGNAAYGAWDTIFGWTGIDFGGDSDPHLEEDLQRLAQSNQDLEAALDNLSEKMDSSSVAEAMGIYSQQVDNINKQMRNTQEAMLRSHAASSNGFLGIGGDHSSGYEINQGMTASEWQEVSKVVGRTVNDAEDFFNLTSEEMWRVANEATYVYSKIKDLADNGYRDAAQYMDEYISYWKELEELQDQYREKLTSTSFDAIKNDFRSALLDMEDSTEDFAKNFEKMMQQAILESFMTEKYDEQLKSWYKYFAHAMEDGALSNMESLFLESWWGNITNDATKEWEALRESMGWDSGTSSQQSATAREAQKITYDQASHIEGRLNAIYEAQLRGLDTSQGIYNVAEDARNIIAQSYLELQQINENTGNSAKYLKDIKADIAVVKQNTSRL